MEGIINFQETKEYLANFFFFLSGMNYSCKTGDMHWKENENPEKKKQARDRRENRRF